jgi:hypothetical protein
MAIIPQRNLFRWDQIEACSDLDRLRLVLSVLPDEAFMRRLEVQRGRGRDDYPIRPMWNAVLAGIVFQHASVASLLRELRRNAELRQVCGFDPLKGASSVPPDAAMSRFLALLMDDLESLQEMFHDLVRRVSTLLLDLG